MAINKHNKWKHPVTGCLLFSANGPIGWENTMSCAENWSSSVPTRPHADDGWRISLSRLFVYALCDPLEKRNVNGGATLTLGEESILEFVFIQVPSLL